MRLADCVCDLGTVCVCDLSVADKLCETDCGVVESDGHDWGVRSAPVA